MSVRQFRFHVQARPVDRHCICAVLCRIPRKGKLCGDSFFRCDANPTMPIAAGLPQLACITDWRPLILVDVWAGTYCRDWAWLRGCVYLGTAAHSVIFFSPSLTDLSNRANQSTFMLACIRDVGSGKLRNIRTEHDAGATWLPNKKRPQLSTASGSDVKRKFSNQDRSSERAPSEPEPGREPTGSLIGTGALKPCRRETSAVPQPLLGAGSPSVSVCARVSLISQVPSPFPSMRRADPHLHSIGHATPCQRSQGPALRHSSNSAAEQKKKHAHDVAEQQQPAPLVPPRTPPRHMEKPGHTEHIPDAAPGRGTVTFP